MKKAIFGILMCYLGLMSTCSVAQESYPVETFVTDSGKQVQVTMIKHGSLAINVANQTILIDPVGNFYGQKVDYSSFKPTAIFITHEHGDHLDAATIDALSSKETLLFLNETSQKQINKGKILKNGDKTKLSKDIKVEVVPAYNTTAGREKFHPKGNGNGYVFDIDGLRLYVSGDTEDIPELQDLKNIDIAFLSANQPYTMTTEQCVKAAKAINPKVLIPYHLGETDVKAIADNLKATTIDVKLFDSLK